MRNHRLLSNLLSVDAKKGSFGNHKRILKTKRRDEDVESRPKKRTMTPSDVSNDCLVEVPVLCPAPV